MFVRVFYFSIIVPIAIWSLFGLYFHKKLQTNTHKSGEKIKKGRHGITHASPLSFHNSLLQRPHVLAVKHAVAVHIPDEVHVLRVHPAVY